MKKVFPIIFLLLITTLIFWQFFLKGLYPFPGDYLLAWYEPWKTLNTKEQTITIPHKPVADDVFRQLYPFKLLGIEMIKKGELPLWNPYNGAGMPLFAAMHHGLFNPVNLVFILLPSYLAWFFYIFLQPILLGLGTYLYTRTFGLTRSASIFSSIILIFSGFVITRLIFGEYLYPLIYLPFLLFIIEKHLQNKSRVYGILIPLSLGFLFLSGHPQAIFYVITFSFVYALYRGLKMRSLLIFYLGGIGLGAIQLFPTIELFLHANINKESSLFIFEKFLLPVEHFLTILVPNYFGNRATYNYWGKIDYIETVLAIGTIPVFFSFFSLLNFKNKNSGLIKFYFITIVITLLANLDWFLARLLASLPIPIISTSIPSRIFMLTTFSFAILSGYGLDLWIRKKASIKHQNIFGVAFFLVLLILAIVTFLFYYLNISCNNKFIPECRIVALRNTAFELVFFSIFFLIFIFNAFIKTDRIKFSWIILALVVFAGLYNSNKFLPFSDKNTFLPSTPLIAAIQEKTKDGRVFGFGKANIKTDFATHFRYFDPNYYDPLYNKRYGELITFANTGSYSLNPPRSDVEIVNEATVSSSLHPRREKLLSLLGVKYRIFNKGEYPKQPNMNILWEDDYWYIQEIIALPRAYIISDFEIVNTPEKILKRLFDSDFKINQKVILEKNPSIQKATITKHSTIIENYEEKKASLLTETDGNGLLLLSDNYYPGWKAYVDSKETKVYRANYTFRAIEIPKGKHNVEFIYKPSSFYIGTAISIASLFVLFLLKRYSMV